MVSHLALWALLGTGATVTLVADEFGLATQGYVDGQIMGLEDKVEDNTERLDQLLAGQKAQQIEKILRYRCMTGSSDMDDTLRDLEAEYFRLAGQRYQRPSCEFLLDAV